MIKVVFVRHAADLEKVMAPLEPQERFQLVNLLKKAGRHAESLGGGASAKGGSLSA